VRGGYEAVPSPAELDAAQVESQVGSEGSERARSDVSDKTSGIGAYFGAPGMGTAMIGAGGAMMEAAGQSGANFGGSLGTGLKEFAAQRAKFGESEIARRKLTETQNTGLDARTSTVTAMLDQAGIVDPVERAQALNMAQSPEGFTVIKGQLEAKITSALETSSQEMGVDGLLNILGITDAETRANFNNLPTETALKMLEDRYSGVQEGAGGVDQANHKYYLDLLEAAGDDEVKIAAAEAFLDSTRGTGSRPATAIQIEDRIMELGNPGFKLGDPYNAAQTQLMAIARGIPVAYGGQLRSRAQMGADDRLMTVATDWDSTGRTLFNSKLDKFDGILEALGDSDSISGPLVGSIVNSSLLPEGLKASLLPGAMNTRDEVNSIVFESLRDTLGAQFTEKEGERLVAAAFNGYLPEELNRIRIERLRNEIKATASYNDGLIDHYNEHGTFINSGNPYLLGEGESAFMGHLLIEAADYEGLNERQMLNAISSDVSNLTRDEALALYVDLTAEVESAAVLALRAQILEKVN
tara:strand:- start:3342 stop:4919 length:1578 start_codon:yes stop_codon:yes gene_type:complete